MKKFIFLALWLPTVYSAQIDTFYNDNYRDIYRRIVSPISNDTTYDLLKSEKLYFNPWKPAFYSLFFTDWATAFFILPSRIEKDKWYHIGAGMVIGAGSNLLAYKITKKKWLSFGIGTLTPIVVGGVKELIDPYIGHVRSVNDFYFTALGGLNGSVTVLIPIGSKELKRKKYRKLGINEL